MQKQTFFYYVKVIHEQIRTYIKLMAFYRPLKSETTKFWKIDVERQNNDYFRLR